MYSGFCIQTHIFSCGKLEHLSFMAVFLSVLKTAALISFMDPFLVSIELQTCATPRALYCVNSRLCNVRLLQI